MGKEHLDTPCHCQQGPIAILALGSYSYWIVRGGVGRIIIHVGYVCVCFVKEVDVCEMILSLSSFGKRVLLLECVSAFFEEGENSNSSSCTKQPKGGAPSSVKEVLHLVCMWLES